MWVFLFVCFFFGAFGSFSMSEVRKLVSREEVWGSVGVPVLSAKCYPGTMEENFKKHGHRSKASGQDSHNQGERHQLG